MSKLGLCCAAAALLALSSCTSDTSDFYIVNKGRNDIADVTVATRDATWRLGDLPRGRMVRFAHHLSGEGGPVISWTVAGKRVARQGCYYTGGVPSDGSIAIVDERVVYHCQ